MAIKEFENVIIGSGEAGKYLAWTLGKKGQRTATIERGKIGGACPNVACLPTKNVIHSAQVASFVRHAKLFGIETGPVTINMAGVTARKQQMVEDLQKIHLDNFAASGVEIVRGEGRFIEPRTLRVTMTDGGERVLRGERVFLNVGTRAQIPPIPGLAEAQPLTHVEALDLTRLPAHLVVLGGGYVGIEFAQALLRLGSKVTLIHRGPRLLEREDAEVSEALSSLLHDEGAAVLLSTQIVNVTGRSGESVELKLSDGKTIAASDILVATGRVPNTDRLDAKLGRVDLDAHGYIRTNDRLETTAASTWAMGECAGSPAFTHVSFDDFRIVRDNLAGGLRTKAGRAIPYCLFTDPELAHIGLSETEAKTQNIRYRLAKIPIASVLRTRTLSATRGFVKAIIAPAPDDRIIGFTAFCVEASELLAAVQTAMLAGLPYTALRDAIFAHPTISEGLTVLFASPPKEMNVGRGS